MRIYEYFRKTKETYICVKINLDGKTENILNFNIYFLKHMFEQFIINSFINIYIWSISDSYLDNHHLIEDLGISLGKIIKYSIKNKSIINRYGFSFVPLDECLTLVVLDICGRSNLIYNFIYKDIYIGNLDIRLIYDFFFSFINNSNITLHINNLYGFNIHHKIETIFKALGISFRKALKFSNKINSTKGILF